MKFPLTPLIVFLASFLGLPLVRAAAPANDNFANAEVVSSFPAVIVGNNFDATLEAGEPAPDSFATFAGKSVWYEWTATTSGEVLIDTLASSFDTILTVWTGSTLGGLVEVATSDQYANTNQSALFLNAVAGTTYRIAIYGWGPTVAGADEGLISLSIGPDTTSSISGKVYLPDGTTPAAGMRVQIMEYFGATEFEATTAVDGTYTIRGLVEGNYALRFSDPFGVYASEFWDNQPSYDLSDRVAVGAEAHVTGIDASLVLAGEIRGRVVNALDELLENISISAYMQIGSGEFASWQPVAFVLSSGFDFEVTPGSPVNFTMTGLQPGTYRLVFTDPASNYTTAYYLNEPDQSAATPIPVTGAAITTLQPMVMSVSSSISGTVSGPGGTLLSGIEVIAYRQNPDPLDPYWFEVRNTLSGDLNGIYTLTGLQPGSYRIYFTDPSGMHLPEYYIDSPDLAGALTVTVGEGTQTFDIDAQLAPAGVIAGSLFSALDGVPLQNVEVQIFRVADGDMAPDYYAYTSSGGAYASEALPPGDYYVSFDDLSNYHQSAYFTTTGGSIDVADASPVTVVVGTSAMASQSLHRFPSISGVVRNASSVPIGNIGVAAYNATTGFLASQAVTRGDGSYILGGLPANESFHVAFFDLNRNYVGEWHENVFDYEDATPVSVLGMDTTLTGVDAELGLGARIQGRVVSSVTGLPISNVEVVAYREVTVGAETTLNEESFGFTNPNGDYDIRGLREGTYVLFYSPSSFQEFIPEYHNDQPDNGPASTRFTIGTGSVTSNVDVDLTPYSTIQGRVTGAGGNGISGASVNLYAFNGGVWSVFQSTFADENGDYLIGGLRAGDYRIEFKDLSDVHVTEFHSNAATIETASPVTVLPGQSISGLDATLSLTVQIEPRITALRKVGASDYQIEFLGNIGTLYQLQQSTTLSGWMPVGAPFAGTPGTQTINVTTTEPRVFWRFVTVP